MKQKRSINEFLFGIYKKNTHSNDLNESKILESSHLSLHRCNCNKKPQKYGNFKIKKNCIKFECVEIKYR